MTGTMANFKCKKCGHIHTGDKAPAECPVCKAPASEFELVQEGTEKKKGLNTNSNAYTVIYATVLTILVAVLLSAAALGLKDKQQANADNEKKQQILSSVSKQLGQEVTFDNAAELWEKLNMKDNMLAVKTDGSCEQKDVFGIVPKTQFSKGVVKDDAELPVFVANINGTSYNIMCMYGAGLWNEIWGYIAVDSEGKVAGCSFDHAGETAGLGAKIKDDPNFAKAFIGKNIFTDGKMTSIAIVKSGKASPYGGATVDCITGATKTCDGVSEMIYQSLKGYENFLLAGKPMALNSECAGEHKCEGNCNGEHKCEGQCNGEHKCKGEGQCNGDCEKGEGQCEKCENK